MLRGELYCISRSACHGYSRRQKAGKINEAKNNTNGIKAIFKICAMRGHIFYKHGVDSSETRSH